MSQEQFRPQPSPEKDLFYYYLEQLGAKIETPDLRTSPLNQETSILPVVHINRISKRKQPLDNPEEDDMTAKRGIVVPPLVEETSLSAEEFFQTKLQLGPQERGLLDRLNTAFVQVNENPQDLLSQTTYDAVFSHAFSNGTIRSVLSEYYNNILPSHYSSEGEMIERSIAEKKKLIEDALVLWAQLFVRTAFTQATEKFSS